MNILEIAKECGAFGGYTDLTHSKLYTIFKDEQLQAFAQAVIENYKEKLRPVTVISSYAGIELKLYALPEEKQNESSKN